MMKESGVTTNSLLVDAGSFVSLSQKQPLEKTILVLLGLREIGVDAISIGYRDTHRLTAIQLKEMEKEYNFPFISANLISLQDETLLFPAYKIVEVDGENGKNRVGVIGVVQGGPYREIPVEQGMKITDPVEAITETITKISGSVEFIILLTDAPQPTIAAWLVQAATNEINLIITSSGRVNHRRNLDIEGVPLFSAGKQGKYFDIIIAQPEEGGWIISREFEDLGPTTKDDEKMAHFINEMISTLGITER
ncbi:hypothetical protein K8I28_13035 [bacterium]|nr:hypothetical protein [bacterium]